jgi:hypothetical protein
MESNQIPNQKVLIVPTFVQQQKNSSYSKITIKIVYNDLIFNWSVNFLDLNFNHAIVRRTYF